MKRPQDLKGEWKNMKKLVLALVLMPAMVLLLGGMAYADTLTFTGTTANGVNGPYGMRLNSGPSTPMICFSGDNYITSGEEWNVLTYNITTVGALAGTEFGASTAAKTVFDYNELGYLANELFADPGNASLQQAIWAVLDLGGTYNSHDTAAYNAVEGGYVTSDVFYIPEGDHYWDGTPQPFIQQTPESSSFVLLGTGLLGLIGLSLKRATA